MTDHESFVLLAAKQLSEPLSSAEEDELTAHLAECPRCRSMAAGMRRDNDRLQAELGAAPVSPRVRARVLDEATGRRRIDGRLGLGLAAVLLLGALGASFIAGGRAETTPVPSARAESPTRAPTPSSVPSLAVPSASPASPLSSTSPTAPTLSPSPSGSAAFVAAAYTYGQRPPRKDTVAARFEDGKPVGEWSRIMPADGSGDTWGGPITCLVISGSDAWLAGPATTATDGRTDGAALIHLHDGGPDGEDDSALIWLTPRGQTITTVTNWCMNKFVPAGPSPLTNGDVEVEDGR